MAWTPYLIKLFEGLKVVITSSPLLSRFDSQKPTLLKADCIVEGMGCILIQTSNDIESTTATEHLLKTGECKFDLTKHGAMLQTIAFGSQRCDYFDSDFHSFTG